jgi:hypothetical protein
MEWYVELGLGSTNYYIHHQITTHKWDTIFKCAKVVKTLDQCKNKWDHTWKDFKRIWDNNQNTPSRRSSFWAITGLEGESTFKLTTIIPKQAYFQLRSWLLDQSREFDTQNLMDTIILKNPSDKFI